MIVGKVRECIECHMDKPLEEFDKNGVKDLKKSYCKTCRKSLNRKAYLKRKFDQSRKRSAITIETIEKLKTDPAMLEVPEGKQRVRLMHKKVKETIREIEAHDKLIRKENRDKQRKFQSKTLHIFDESDSDEDTEKTQ